MKTIDIKGKEYVMVNERIIYFRANYPEHKLQTQMISNENGVCVFRAVILNDKNEVIATGHAYEDIANGFINKTSYIENCETSAVGRALGMLGIGIDNSIATAEEVANAILNQNKQPTITDEQKTVNWISFIAEKRDIVEKAGHNFTDTIMELGVDTVKDLEDIAPQSRFAMAKRIEATIKKLGEKK